MLCFMLYGLRLQAYHSFMSPHLLLQHIEISLLVDAKNEDFSFLSIGCFNVNSAIREDSEVFFCVIIRTESIDLKTIVKINHATFHDINQELIILIIVITNKDGEAVKAG